VPIIHCSKDCSVHCGMISPVEGRTIAGRLFNTATLLTLVSNWTKAILALGCSGLCTEQALLLDLELLLAAVKVERLETLTDQRG
jgi:hypothetical protein